MTNAMLDAANEVIRDPAAHARIIRIGQSLMSVSSIEDPNPVRAVGIMFETAIEHLVGLGFSKEFIVDFAANMIDMLSSAAGDKLREAAKKQQG